MEFNREQQAVIAASGGYHLVLAPPGCGKTAVLAERVVWARKQGVDFSQMACLTFTNRAARGMRERILERTEGNGQRETDGVENLFVGNVHRFCSQFLFQSGVLPEQAAVIDTDMSMSILADYLGEDELLVLAEAKHRQRYSQVINLQHLMYQCCRHYPSSLIVHRDAMRPRALRELCVAFELPYTQASAIELYRHADTFREEGAILSSDARQLLFMLYAAGRYEQYKRQNDLVDFEDLLLLTYDAMTEDGHGGEKETDGREGKTVWPRYDWIQVDEVQDLNPLQLAIIDLFTNDGATVVYLGDSQQAIFSFMGAKTDTLQLLRERCGANGFHNFYQNYRSPRYLLNVFNEYGERQLAIARDLLPTTQNEKPCEPGCLVLMEAETNIDEVNMVARCVRELYEQHPQETTAVVVAFNSDADEVSAAMGTLPHFKISGIDLFTTVGVRTLLAHLCVLTMEQNFIAWTQLLTGLRVFQSSSASRRFVHAMMEQAIAPTDFLVYEDSTYVAEFVKAYEGHDIIVFDTETTGLSVFDDDVVQIAALRTRQGRVVGTLNLFVETDRKLPPMLGDVANPLVEEYGLHEHLSHEEAMRRFVEFAKDGVILGHNATYDYQILEHNMRRYAPELSMQQLWPTYFDTLKLTRLLHPRLKSYKLKSLLAELGLEGQNSHLADDDIVATLSLVTHDYSEARKKVGRQLEFASRHRRTAEKLRMAYRDLYLHAVDRLYVETEGPALSMELQHAYEYLREQQRIGEIPKLVHLVRYVESDLLTPKSGRSLAEQLACHIPDLTTMKEADLCGASSMQERVFVSTVHKAKGLEFDNVIVFDAVEGKFPSSFGNDLADDGEEGRKFYVAISRARRRLMISYCHTSVNRWGRTFQKTLTPYMKVIRHYFEKC